MRARSHKKSNQKSNTIFYGEQRANRITKIEMISAGRPLTAGSPDEGGAIGEMLEWRSWEQKDYIFFEYL